MAQRNSVSFQTFQLGDLTIGAAFTQGTRNVMEDRILVHQFTELISNFRLTAVLDGHEGSEAANYCVANLPGYLQTEISSLNYLQAVNGLSNNLEQFRIDLGNIVERFDEQLRGTPFISCGTTLSGCLHTPDFTFIIQLGDSVSFIKEKSPIPVSAFVHRADNIEEKNRIQRLRGHAQERGYEVSVNGSNVFVRDPAGIHRRQEPTRVFGDTFFKTIPDIQPREQPVVSVPLIKVRRRHQVDDGFTSSYTDGLSRFFSPSFISCYIVDELRKNTPVQRIAYELIRGGIMRAGTGDNDNSSIVIAVYLSMFRKVASKRIMQSITNSNKANSEPKLAESQEKRFKTNSHERATNPPLPFSFNSRRVPCIEFGIIPPLFVFESMSCKCV